MADDKPAFLNTFRKMTEPEGEKSSVMALAEVLALAKSVTEDVFGHTPEGVAALPLVLREMMEYDYEDDRQASQPTLFEDDSWLR